MKTEKQIIVPTVTPLTADFKLDKGAVEKMFLNFSSHNVKPFILGTTGEAASMPIDLKKEFITTACLRKQVDDVIYAGIASNCLVDSIEFAKYCFGNGISAVAAHLPSYYLLSINEIRKYFEQLADALPGPLIIYNIPATTHMSIPLKVIDELSYHPNIIGTKDSERSEERLRESLKLWKDRKDFKHYLGWAAKSADALLNGSDGLIPSTGNLNPNIYREMLLAVEEGRQDAAHTKQLASDKLGELYQKGRLLVESLAALKILMKHEGLCETFMMPPLQQLPGNEVKMLIAEYEELKQTEFIKI
jgi:dihydrodipicolinate synthase/N-acetylneuraminate lyase